MVVLKFSVPVDNLSSDLGWKFFPSAYIGKFILRISHSFFFFLISLFYFIFYRHSSFLLLFCHSFIFASH